MCEMLTLVSLCRQSMGTITKTALRMDLIIRIYWHIITLLKIYMRILEKDCAE